MRASGQPARLFDLFAGPNWTLLGTSTRRGAFPPRPGLRVHVFGSDLLDVSGHFRAAYGLETGEWVLVRPDGYVAGVAAGDGEGAVSAYLVRMGLDAGNEPLRGSPAGTPTAPFIVG